MFDNSTIIGQLLYLTYNDDIIWEYDSQMNRYFFVKKLTKTKYLKFELIEHPVCFIDVSFVKKGAYSKEIRFIRELRDEDMIKYLYNNITSKPVKFSKNGKEE